MRVSTLSGVVIAGGIPMLDWAAASRPPLKKNRGEGSSHRPVNKCDSDFIHGLSTGGMDRSFNGEYGVPKTLVFATSWDGRENTHY